MSFLDISALVKNFGALKAIAGLDLALASDELLCIIGPNGCGKTTLFNLICGELRPDEGTITLRGENLALLSPWQVARRGVIRKFQVPSIYDDLSIAENIAVAENMARQAGRSALPILDDVALENRPDDKAGILSHGEKQWLEIAMVLAAGPQLVLLDEPTAGMTRSETARTVALIAQIHRQYGLAMIMIEHDMRFVEALECDVAVMMDGRIISRGSYGEVSKMSEVREAYLGAALA
jgi:urea transport system ATP-binding protein